jgi:hypothetical protein
LRREREDVRRTGGERACRLAQPAGARIAHHRKPCRRGERAHDVEARDTGDAGDVVERQRAVEMAFDIPKRLLGWIHDQQLSCEATPVWSLPAGFT